MSKIGLCIAEAMAPVLVAKHGVEEWRGGIGGRGGAHHTGTRLSELSVNFQYLIFAGQSNWFEPLRESTFIFDRAVTQRRTPALTGAWLRRAEICRKIIGGSSIT